MPSVRLASQLLVGIPQVDREHQRLFDIVDEVEAALALPPVEATPALTHAVRELIDYTRTHFASEERLMQTAGYPALNEHLQLHRDLLAQVQDMELRLAVGDDAAALDLSRFLGNWLRTHIQTADRAFGHFATGCGGDPRETPAPPTSHS